MVIIATPSATDANSYVTLEEADELMEGAPPKTLDKWDDLEEDDQNQMLVESARKIDQYKAWGEAKVPDQALAFPRHTDKTDEIPLGVKRAVLEYLIYRLDGTMHGLKRLQSEGVTSASILGQASSFEVDRSELPAGARKELDRLYNAYWPTPITNREFDGSTDPDSFFG